MANFIYAVFFVLLLGDRELMDVVQLHPARVETHTCLKLKRELCGSFSSNLLSASSVEASVITTFVIIFIFG